MIFTVFFIISMAVPLIVLILIIRSVKVKGSWQGVFIFKRNILGFDDGIIDVDGQKVQLDYHSGSKNHPSCLELALAGDFFANAILRHETGVDRFAKQIGLNQEIQLYEQDFDNEVYIECEDQDFVRQCLSSSDLRAQLKDLLHDFTSLKIEGGRCALIKTPCSDLGLFTPEKVSSAAAALVQFAQGIPKAQPGQTSATPVTDQVRSSSNVLVGIGVILIIAGIGALVWGFISYPPLDPWQFFLASLKIGIPLFFGYILFVYHQVKGSSQGVALLTGAFFAALIGIPLFVFGGMMVVNGSQDVSAAKEHTTSVISKYVSHSKNSTTCHIMVNPWVTGADPYNFTVAWSTYDRINIGDPCVITTRGGLLGKTWVSARKCGR